MDDLTKHELSAIREIIFANDRRYSEQAKATSESIRLEFAANDRRLEGMNGFRSAMADQAAGMMSRSEADAHHEAILGKIEQQRTQTEARLSAAISPLDQKVDALLRPNWALWVSWLSIISVLCAGAWIVLGLQISAATTPLQLLTEQTRITAGNADARLTQLERNVQGYSSHAADIEHLKAGQAAASERGSAVRADLTRQAAALVEVETQFCAADIMRNLMHANDLRYISLLWQRSFPTHLPTDNAYYPVICNRPGSIQSGEGRAGSSSG